jgi:peroxiredoxin (alkyl hydroperoxide reductase subunit C)
VAHLIAKEAPNFAAETVMGDNSIESEFTLSTFRGKYIILFFYPFDFSFVCPTEILAFDEKLEEFKNRDAEVIGVSVDSFYTHLAWKKTPVEKGGIGSIKYPLVSDLKRTISNAYGVLQEDEVALRALFLIDREGIVRHAVLNDTSLGRNVNEALRMLDALRHHDEHGKLCPANWEKGRESLDSSNEGIVDYLSKFAKKG